MLTGESNGATFVIIVFLLEEGLEYTVTPIRENIRGLKKYFSEFQGGRQFQKSEIIYLNTAFIVVDKNHKLNVAFIYKPSLGAFC